MVLTQRLWRARRRHHHIDAVLRPGASAWALTFLYDDGELMSWPFGTREAAVADADRRLTDLQRAGWNVHW